MVQPPTCFLSLSLVLSVFLQMFDIIWGKGADSLKEQPRNPGESVPLAHANRLDGVDDQPPGLCAL